ncbi:hypothetical protein [Pseudoalteromonas umbrosa]|uniref:hypothetical protein n=1 Tax=Pseudoalteromonas umbrosa TaxID=3048489 RepID=UPI0024C27E4D|nr:hypothetical protein [Pseudoalteromonas sp. B95]MDK1289818.1 hypothetical protein [Pseudoalteromonas sp. B95]
MNSIYKRAIEHWGAAAQVSMAMGEMGELTAELNRFHTQNRKDRLSNLQDEIADVQIMLNQLKMMHGQLAIEEIMEQKLARLESIINGQQQHNHQPEAPHEHTA